MKKKFYIILFSLFAISLITGCGGFPKYDATREKKLKKTLQNVHQNIKSITFNHFSASERRAAANFLVLTLFKAFPL